MGFRHLVFYQQQYKKGLSSKKNGCLVFMRTLQHLWLSSGSETVADGQGPEHGGLCGADWRVRAPGSLVPAPRLLPVHVPGRHTVQLGLGRDFHLAVHEHFRTVFSFYQILTFKK